MSSFWRLMSLFNAPFISSLSSNLSTSVSVKLADLIVLYTSISNPASLNCFSIISFFSGLSKSPSSPSNLKSLYFCNKFFFASSLSNSAFFLFNSSIFFCASSASLFSVPVLSFISDAAFSVCIFICASYLSTTACFCFS